MQVDFFGVLYALFLAIGGGMGYAKSGNVLSLGAGFITGSFAGFGAYKNDARFNLSVSVFVLCLMGCRFAVKRKFLPDAVTGLISLLMTVRNTMKYVHGDQFRLKLF